MRKSTLLAACLAAVLVAALPAPSARADVAVSFSFFYDTLGPQGHWVSVAPYGRVWYPASVSAGWQPYTVGRWAYTDYGWTWISADPWGDVTYRYGTWTFAPAYGWVWVPGFVWAPAWVTWSFTNDYVGWAPIPPSFSLTVSGYYGSPVVVSRSAYCFVPANRFYSHNVAAVRVSPKQNTILLQRSQRVTRYEVAGGVVRNVGPQQSRIERVTRTPISRTSARELGIQPAKIDTARAAGRRIPVAAPASAKGVERVDRRDAVGQKKRSAPAPAVQPARPRSQAAPQKSEKIERRIERAPASTRAPGRPESSRARAAAPPRSEKVSRHAPPPKAPQQVRPEQQARPPAAAKKPAAKKPEKSARKPERRSDDGRS